MRQLNRPTSQTTPSFFNNLYIAHGNFLCNLLQSFFWLAMANFAYFCGFQTIFNTEMSSQIIVL